MSVSSGNRGIFACVRQGNSPAGKQENKMNAVKNQGTERTRQKLFVFGFGVFVNTSRPPSPAEFVTSGTQLIGDRLKVRSSA